jgi:4-amino-4-deoxy-L-arabinose transferase-like glycosyltransferase
VVAVAVGFGIRLFFGAGNDIVSADETAYLTSGLNFWSGHGFTTLSGGAETHFPPGLPFLLGGVHQIIGGDPHTAMTIVNLLCTTLVLLPLAGLARLVSGRRAGVLAAWLVALCPALVALPLYSGGSAGPFTLFAATALWLALRTPPSDRRGTLVAAVGSGLLVSMAYLTRPEGLFFAFVLVPVLALPVLGGWRGLRRADAAAWRRAATVTAAFAIPFFLLIAPYAIYLHGKTGKWELTAKTEGISLPAWRAVAADNRQVAHAIMYRPVGDGYEFPARESISSLVGGDPGAYLAIVNVNIGRLYRAFFNASLTPYPNWPLLPGVLFLLAIFAAWRKRHQRAVLAVLAAMAVPVITTLAFFVIPRYLIPTAAFACVLIAIGLVELPSRWFKLATIAAFVLVASSTAAALHGNVDGWFHPLYGYPEHREVGEWIRDHSEPDDLVMSTNMVPGYYAQRRVVPTPWAQPERIVDFARHYGVRYLIVDEAHGTRFRPQLRKLIPRSDVAGLRAVHRVREDERRTIVYELEPRPPPFDGKIPLLDLSDSG